MVDDEESAKQQEQRRILQGKIKVNDEILKSQNSMAKGELQYPGRYEDIWTDPDVPSSDA